MQARPNLLRWLAAISIVAAAACGTHAQAEKPEVVQDGSTVLTAKVEGGWGLKIGSEQKNSVVIVLHQMNPTLWGQIVILPHSDYPLTGMIRGNEIMFSSEIDGVKFDVKGEVKGEAMAGSVSLRSQDVQWTATRLFDHHR